MPFGLLVTATQRHFRCRYRLIMSPMPFGLLVTATRTTGRSSAANPPSRQCLSAFWSLRRCGNARIVGDLRVANAFRPSGHCDPVALEPRLAAARCRQCLSAFWSLRPGRLTRHPSRLGGRQCLSAFWSLRLHGLVMHIADRWHCRQCLSAFWSLRRGGGAHCDMHVSDVANAFRPSGHCDMGRSMTWGQGGMVANAFRPSGHCDRAARAARAARTLSPMPFGLLVTATLSLAQGSAR